MESRSYNSGTASKKSTMLDNKFLQYINKFP